MLNMLMYANCTLTCVMQHADIEDTAFRMLNILIISYFLALLEIEQHIGYIGNSEIHQNSESSWGAGILCQINSIKNSSILDALLDN